MKWFFKAQAEASKQLYSLYENCPCVFQVVGKDRVIEVYQCSNPTDKEWTLWQIIITKQGKSASVNIYQLEYKYGWKVQDNPKSVLR